MTRGIATTAAWTAAAARRKHRRCRRMHIVQPDLAAPVGCCRWRSLYQPLPTRSHVYIARLCFFPRINTRHPHVSEWNGGLMGGWRGLVGGGRDGGQKIRHDWLCVRKLCVAIHQFNQKQFSGPCHSRCRLHLVSFRIDP